MNKTLKVLLSCLIGSGIGIFIALSVNSWFWWTGALAGGVIGYLSYEFKKVIQAIPRAWRAVSSWKPNKYFWKAYFIFTGFVFQLMAPCVVLLAFVFSSGKENTHPIMVGLVSTLFISLLFGFAGADGFSSRESIEKKERIIKLYKSIYLQINVFVGAAYLIYALIMLIINTPKGIWKGFCACGRFGLLIGRFFKKLFLLVHSEIRLLCAVDSLVGVVAGYLISQAYSLNLLTGVIVGMIAGALLGLANYQIFSVWILKLALKNGEK